MKVTRQNEFLRRALTLSPTAVLGVALSLGATSAHATAQAWTAKIKVRSVVARSNIESSGADFFAKLRIEGQLRTTPCIDDRNVIFPNWSHRVEVRRTFGQYRIAELQVELWDYDPISANDAIDIDPAAARSLRFILLLDPVRRQAGLFDMNSSVAQILQPSPRRDCLTTRVSRTGNRGDRASIELEISLVEQPDFVIESATSAGGGRTWVKVRNRAGGTGTLRQVGATGFGRAAFANPNRFVSSRSATWVLLAIPFRRGILISCGGVDCNGDPELNTANNDFVP